MSATFAEAARTYEGLVGKIRPDQWDGPGLGEWTGRTRLPDGFSVV